MKSNASLLYNCFLVVGDFLSLLLAFVGAYILRVTLNHKELLHHVRAMSYLEIFLVMLPFWILMFALLGLYNNAIYEKRFPELGRLLMGSFLGILFIIGYSYFFSVVIFPAHLVAVYGLALAFILLIIFRTLARYIRGLLFSYNFGITNVLVVGDTHISHELVTSMYDFNISGYRIVGVVGPLRHNNELFKSIPLFKTFEEATSKLGDKVVQSIVQTELYSEPSKNNQVLSYAQSHHVAYRFIPGNTELFVGNIEVELFRSSIPVIAVHQTALFGWGRVFKRLFDLLVSILTVIILSPFFLIIAIAIEISDPGALIFKQERITRFDTRFKVYKFRTLKKKYSGKDPIESFRDLGREDLAKEWGKAGKLEERRDARITPLGQFLRRFSLDELPQLFNVIKGDISLVGPRAVIPEELKWYEDKSQLLLSVKTGITGLAQVSGRSDLDYYERAKLDFYYVQNWSFWLDLTIIFKTIRVVFRRSGKR
jgi:exopolysaccharide biosynthesis polyprenyl glycosylphosphotransferase